MIDGMGMDIDTSTVGGRIRWIIKKNGLKNTEFARRLGIAGSYVTHLIQGKNPPSSALVKSISLVFGIREEWILTGEGVPEALEPVDTLTAMLSQAGLPPVFRDVFLAYLSLTDAQRDGVDRFCRACVESIVASGSVDLRAQIEAEVDAQIEAEVRAEAEEYYRLRLDEKREIAGLPPLEDSEPTGKSWPGSAAPA